MPISPLIPIDKLYSWKDASDESTITSSSGRVSEWADKFNTNFNGTQSSGGNKPYTGTRTMNGLNAIEFTGDEFFDVADNSMLRVPQTIFIASTIDSFEGVGVFLSKISNTVLNNLIVFGPTQTYFNGEDLSNGIGSSFIDPADPLLSVEGMLAETSGSEVCFSIFVDVAKYSQISTNNRNSYSIFTPYHNTLASFTNSDVDVATSIGAYRLNGPGDQLKAAIGEILIFDGELSILEQGNVFKYLNTKWGIA